MTTGADEWGRGAHTELVQTAAILDRLRAQCPDADLAAKLGAIRAPVSAIVDLLAERFGLWQPTQSDLINWRWRPWDRL